MGTSSEDAAPDLGVFVNEHEGIGHVVVAQMDDGGADPVADAPLAAR